MPLKLIVAVLVCADTPLNAGKLPDTPVPSVSRLRKFRPFVEICDICCPLIRLLTSFVSV